MKIISPKVKYKNDLGAASLIKQLKMNDYKILYSMLFLILAQMALAKLKNPRKRVSGLDDLNVCLLSHYQNNGMFLYELST